MYRILAAGFLMIGIFSLTGCDVDASTNHAAAAPSSKTPSPTKPEPIMTGTLTQLAVIDDVGIPEGSRIEIYQEFSVITTSEGVSTIVENYSELQGIFFKRD